jgi:heat shock protein HtpX
MVVYDQISKNVFKTYFLLMLFLGLIIGLGWVFAQVYEDPSILYIVAIISSLFAIVSYWNSDKMILNMAGAKELKKEDNPNLYRLIENLTITAGLPMPKVYIINDKNPNAFATGRDKNHAALALNTGLLEILNDNELEGVIAHELSHIGNRDTLIATIAVILVGIINILSDLFLRSNYFRSRDDNKNNNFWLIIGLIVSILAPIAAMFIQLAISRKREYVADSNAALITRYPEGLISALEKISNTPVQRSSSFKTAVEPLYFASYFKIDSSKDKKGLTNKTPWYLEIFSTHPPIEKRIENLKKISYEK